MKKYQISIVKYSPDIEFYRNRLFNILHDLEVSGKSHTDEYKKLFDRWGKVTEILLTFKESRGVISWLTGEQYELVQFCISWAKEERARANHK